MEAGRDIFFLECAVCHTIGGTKNDIIAKTGDLTYMGMLSQLTGQGKVLGYMPPFAGTDKEKEALAAYIIGELHHKEIIAEPAAFDPLPSNNRISPFDPEHDEYLLLVWNDLGMHCITDSSPWFIMLPPANTLEAQLIRRGTRPELVSDGVELRYRVEDGFKNPSRHVNFWKYAKHYFGTHLEENIGVAGNGMNGSFHFEPARNGFIAEMIPVVPYKDDGSFNSYPQFYVEARDKSSGTVLAFTKVVAPTSTEMGCRHCHGGRWRVNDVAGISDETAANVLRTHDRNQGTDLYTRALEGKPTLCQSCHPDPVLGAAGKPGHNNLPASIHGWHANYMYLEGAAACAMCHPAAANGATRCNRGVHAALHMNCTDCHGTLGDHAIALLKNQTGNESTARLLSNLETVAVKTPSEVQPRTPWIQEPDCVSCHVNFRKPSTMASYNQWNDNASQLYRIRTDQTGMRCIACHNSTHSEYPATNPYGTDRDNTQPLQYMGIPLPVGSESTCSACHTREMPLSGHHPNMVRPFRNRSITALK
jgi:predicted metal-binding protein